MTRVWIAQCLCPQRHCIMAAADEAESQTIAERTVLAELRRKVADMLADNVLNPWCGLCRAPHSTWRYEVGRTSFATLPEALPSLLEKEAEQRTTAARLGDGDPGPGSSLP
jgi:hypothetical protein